MIKLFTEKEFEDARGIDKLPLKCEYCGKTFYVQKKMIKHVITHNKHNMLKFCSRKCADYDMHKIKNHISYETKCANCGKSFTITSGCASKSKTGNHFCSKSCAVSYNNKHKTYGTRRSKLESYLENQLSKLYPDLEIKYNSKEEINSELDIFIPKYKLAFELNGIFHYEPIFGSRKLEQTQNNDKNKFQLCQENKISLCVIDTSSLKYFKEQNAEKYLDIIKNIINEALCEQDSNL